MVHLYCHPSWTNLSDEPSGTNDMSQWEVIGVSSLPLSDDRSSPLADAGDKGERISELTCEFGEVPAPFAVPRRSSR
eukprot:12420058-Karenia_brevis.AAC.1